MVERFAAREVRSDAASAFLLMLVFMVGFPFLWLLVCFLVLVLVWRMCGRVLLA